MNFNTNLSSMEKNSLRADLETKVKKSKKRRRSQIGSVSRQKQSRSKSA